MAGGEGCHNYFMAQHMIDHAGLKYVQIDAGRIGGLTVAKAVADYAAAKGVTYVNHTFTSNLALSASLQPYVGLKDHLICEYPTELKQLATEMTVERINLDQDGLIRVPDSPGLGVTPNWESIRKYHVPVEIRVGGRLLFESPKF